MPSCIPLKRLKEIVCVPIGTPYTLVPIPHLSSPLVEVKGIWGNIIEDITVKWYLVLEDREDWDLPMCLFPKFTPYSSLPTPSPPKKRSEEIWRQMVILFKLQ